MRVALLLFVVLAAAPAAAQDVTCPNGVVCRRVTPGFFIDCVPLAAATPAAPTPPMHEHSLPEMIGYWTLGGLHVADVSYTMWMLGSGMGREGNPILSWATEHPGRFAAIKWTAAGAGMWTTWRLFESGHPRLAWLSIAGQAAITGYAVVHNARIYRICRQPGVVCR